MDSGLVTLVPLMVAGGLAISFVLRMLTRSSSGWLAILVGALLPPSLLLAADLIGSGAAYAADAQTAGAIIIVWTVALIPALIGALCGAYAATQVKRRNEF